MEICVAGLTMYNSVFNVSDQYGNKTFQIEMPTASTTTTLNVALNDGYYSYADINRMMIRACDEAGAYLIDADQNKVFFIQLAENSTFYSAQLDLSPVPSSLGTYTQPAIGLYSSGGSGLPSSDRTPRLIVSNDEFGKLIGFSTGTYVPVENVSVITLSFDS